jgi:hypothetical protein
VAIDRLFATAARLSLTLVVSVRSLVEARQHLDAALAEVDSVRTALLCSLCIFNSF